VCLSLCWPLGRHHGPEADDGEAGRAQDTPGREEDDRGGDGRQQQHHQLPGLCAHDAGEALGRAQAVSPPRQTVVTRCSVRDEPQSESESESGTTLLPYFL